MTGPRLSRRSALGLLGAAGAAGAVGVAGGFAAGAAQDSTASGTDLAVPFHGKHQAGIATTVQQHLYFASFDMTSTADHEDLQALLADWTDAAARMTTGREVTPEGAVGGGPYKPPDDTGEALDLAANALTITFGFGPTLFDERFGLAGRRPKELVELPSFAFDLLEDRFSGGDLCIQACANDPQVAVHAIRNLSRIAFGRAQVRWTQLGYGRTSTTSKTQSTPRNLFGFKDGTANIFGDDTSDLAASVWTDGSDQSWMAGGTYLVARKIQMLIESWDRVRLEEQEAIIGRDKGQGAPLSGGTEFTEPDFDVVSTKAGGPAIPETAHVRLAHPDRNGGARLLRRGYNYVEGNNDLGQLNAGLFFLAFSRSPQQFITIQRSLAGDALNEYIRHIGSALFAVPGGVRPGGSVGDGLFT
ncbi:MULTISPECIES: iron uptake transporter deferrochelatase/peroxidase subunit [Aeromicrobium]|uniref:iron uptake transporter deferrochelatase/peroxidase subunit n=1 Tax=Aeromicrobium TaxID=2040 RepID=UPI00257E466F|nr:MULTISPECIES: iron uptake transporter deferrochelatase/peroxidase subunit [Aeromicrobium]